MHLAAALFGTVTATKLTHVPYKGGAATVSAVMGGEATRERRMDIQSKKITPFLQALSAALLFGASAPLKASILC